MDQNQALNLIDNALSKLQLTRSEHETLKIAIALIREVGKRYVELNQEKAEALEAKKTPEKPIDNPKENSVK